MDMQKIGAFLQALRREKNLTQAKLGEQLGVTNKTISRWETGVYLPPADMLLALSQLHGVSINEILAGERIALEHIAEKADENLISIIRDSPFHFKEQQVYWQRKWKHDHRVLRWLLPLIPAGVWLAGLLTGQMVPAIIGCVLLPVALAYLNNQQAIYVEHHLFDHE